MTSQSRLLVESKPTAGRGFRLVYNVTFYCFTTRVLITTRHSVCIVSVKPTQRRVETRNPLGTFTRTRNLLLDCFWLEFSPEYQIFYRSAAKQMHVNVNRTNAVPSTRVDLNENKKNV